MIDLGGHLLFRFILRTRLALLLALLIAVATAAISQAAAETGAGMNRAALVVRFADGSVETRCVSFNEPMIYGTDLLTRSGLQVIMDYNIGTGGAVCSIQSQGCAFPTQDCFCRCQGVQCEYWAYYHWSGSQWEYSQVGASSFEVRDGALEGWSWGPGNWVSGTEPPHISFEQICPHPTPTATAAATPTATPPMARTTLPLITFNASATSLSPGACTLLSWLAWDADRVTLDGATVNGQDRQEVCPTATQRYVLAASNAAGQTQREITIQVAAQAAPGQAPAVPTANWTPTASTPPTAPIPAPLSTLLPAATPTATAATSASSLLAPVAHAQELAPIAAVPLTPERVDTPSVTRPAPTAQIVLNPPVTATPRPRRVLGADGRSTPTPMLVALAPPRMHSGASEAAGQGPNTGSNTDAIPAALDTRVFTPALLPDYAAYLLTVAGLVGAAAWVTRRRNRATT